MPKKERKGHRWDILQPWLLGWPHHQSSLSQYLPIHRLHSQSPHSRNSLRPGQYELYWNDKNSPDWVQDLIDMYVQRIYKEIEISENTITSFLTSEKVVFLSTVIWPGVLKNHLLNSCHAHNKVAKVVAWIVNSVGVVLEFTLKESMLWRNPSITQSALSTHLPFPTWERCPCFPWRGSQRCTRWSQDRSPDDHWRNTELPE